jgi:putative thioredoxin
MDPNAFHFDVGEADFERAVLERSKQVPVVVDFWAPWCGPCRTLGPLLERLAEQHAGAFVLARVNVDEAPALAQRHGVRSIPTVIGVRDGALVGEFVGAQPEPVVRRFVEALLPTEADRLSAEADALARDGHANAAEERYRGALALEARHPRALLGLAHVLGERGDVPAALDLLERVVDGGPLERQAEHLAAELRTRSGQEDAPAEAELRARLAARPDDLAARLDLGRALAAAGRHEEALGELLAVVKAEPAFAEEGARKAMLDVFELLGGDHPLVKRFRGELARALFR